MPKTNIRSPRRIGSSGLSLNANEQREVEVHNKGHMLNTKENILSREVGMLLIILFLVLEVEEEEEVE